MKFAKLADKAWEDKAAVEILAAPIWTSRSSCGSGVRGAVHSIRWTHR